MLSLSLLLASTPFLSSRNSSFQTFKDNKTRSFVLCFEEWKKIKGEALQNVKKVSDEIKPIMAYDTANNPGDDW